MESVLWIIIQFYPDVSTLSLVSTSWYKTLKENTQFIISGIRNIYPASTLHRSVESAILVNDIDTVNKIVSIPIYLPINWKMLSQSVRSGRMIDIISLRISIHTEIEIRERLQIPIRFTIDIDDPRAHLKLYHMMKRGYIPIGEPKGIIEKAINTFGTKGLNLNVKQYLFEKGYTYNDSYRCTEISPYIQTHGSITDEAILMYMSTDDLQKLSEILTDPLCISMNMADILLRQIPSSTKIENRVREQVLAIAFVRGWDHLLDEYFTLDNALIVLSSILLKYPLPERSWKFLEYSDMNSLWFRYYANLVSKPDDLEPTFWRKLLANAVVLGNIPLIKSIISKHRRRIDRQMELKIMNLSRQHGTYSEELMRAITS